MSSSSEQFCLDPGRNCWSVEKAERFGWAIDGASYFEALRDSFEKARREILIIGWDIDSRVELIRDEHHPHYPSPLCETLQSLVDERPDLRVHVLSWDFAMIYVLERELLPAYSFGWQDSDRLHFALDGKHVTGASQHQKVVIVDGNTAYSGGIDITRNRWDTPEHAADDRRRTDPNGNLYGPFHDIQAVVSGAAARKLRALADFRWKNVTGESLPDFDEKTAADCWPDTIEVAARDVDTILARTWADPDSGHITNEVEQLFLDQIHTARKSIYMENQYFTSEVIGEALAARLEESNGPEIVIVLPGKTSGWLEQSTMDVLRNRVVDRLRSADRHDRLRILCPVADELGDAAINVHAKLTITDSRWIRIGSANLSRRSMGLDSECDLLVDAGDSGAALRMAAELIAEHTGSTAEDVRERLGDRGLLRTLDAVNGGERRLEPLQADPASADALLEPLARVADLEKPIERAWSESMSELGNRLLADTDAESAEPPTGSDPQAGPVEAERDQETESGDEETDGGSGGWMPGRRAGFLFLAVIVIGLGVWIQQSLQSAGGDLSPEEILGMLRDKTAHPVAPFLAVPAFVVGALLIAPATWMIALIALLFEPLVASLVSTAGVALATALTHYIGSFYAEGIGSRLPQQVMQRVKRMAAASDVWSLVGLRLIPIAPFTIVNVAVGVSGVRMRPFLLGTLIAMVPGILVLCFSIDRARAALRGEPVFDPWIAVVIVVAGISLVALRVIRNRTRDSG